MRRRDFIKSTIAAITGLIAWPKKSKPKGLTKADIPRPRFSGYAAVARVEHKGDEVEGFEIGDAIF